MPKRVIKITEIKHNTCLICPISEIEDGFYIDQSVEFWIDENDVWHVLCSVCGGEHCIGDMKIRS